MSKSAAPAKSAGMNIDYRDEVKRGTNILTVHVPKEMRVKIASGIDFWDDLLGDGDGMNAGTAILFTGMSGAGKTTLSLQLADALTALGHLVLYNTNEEAAQQVKMTCERLDLKNGFIIGRDRLVPKVIDHMEHLRGLACNRGKKPIIWLDSFQAHDDGFYSNGGTNSNTPVRIAEQLMAWTKSTFGVAVGIGQVKKDGTFAGKNTIRHALDAHVHLAIDRGKRSPTYGERIIECEKNRYGSAGRQWIVGMAKKGVYSKYMIGAEAAPDQDSDTDPSS